MIECHVSQLKALVRLRSVCFYAVRSSKIYGQRVGIMRKYMINMFMPSQKLDICQWALMDSRTCVSSF